MDVALYSRLHTDGGARTPYRGDIFIVHDQKLSNRTPLSKSNIKNHVIISLSLELFSWIFGLKYKALSLSPGCFMLAVSNVASTRQ